MHLAKGSIFIILGLFLDGLQAMVSWGIAAIAAFPGTIGGGAAGCAAGNALAGQLGCWVGGFVLGIGGSLFNGVIAPFTIPLGIVMGFAVNMCLSLVLGWGFLVPLMLLSGIWPKKQLPWGLGEVIPGLNNIPFWTFFTIASLWAHATQKGPAARKSILQVAGLALAPTQGIMNLKERAGDMLGTTQERIPQPNSARELVRSAEQRIPLQDVRPIKPNAQAI